MGAFEDALEATIDYHTVSRPIIEAIEARLKEEVDPRVAEYKAAEGTEERDALVSEWKTSTLGMSLIPDDLDATVRAAVIERGKRVRAEHVREVVREARAQISKGAAAVLAVDSGIGLLVQVRDAITGGDYLTMPWALYLVVGVYMVSKGTAAGHELEPDESSLYDAAKRLVLSNAEEIWNCVLADGSRVVYGVSDITVVNALKALRRECGR